MGYPPGPTALTYPRDLLFRDVHEVEQGVNGVAESGRFVVDHIELVAGTVDQHDPAPQMLRIAGLGEGVGDDLLRRIDHRRRAPFPLRFRGPA